MLADFTIEAVMEETTRPGDTERTHRGTGEFVVRLKTDDARYTFTGITREHMHREPNTESES